VSDLASGPIPAHDPAGVSARSVCSTTPSTAELLSANRPLEMHAPRHRNCSTTPMPTEKAQGHGESTPLGRAGQPAEVAPAYVFFASQESSYITAEMLAVTGGQPVT
jgi:NAD(P)-dependent dehydrogenase (short-subunit alcohol dehydrogenase family)